MKAAEQFQPAASSNRSSFEKSHGRSIERNGHENQKTKPAAALRDERIRLQDLGRAAAFLAHELRQPLGAIQNLAAYLKATNSTADRTASEHLALIEQQAEFAGCILSSLASFARSGAPARKATHLHRVLSSVLKRLSLRPEIRLKQKLAPRLPAVLADPLQVDRIVSNLIANGLESMPGPGTLTVATRAQPGCVLLRITDTGCGIDPALAGDVFQPFVTTKSQGTGLGLALCRELAEANGGFISFRSQPSKGTTFELRLPRV